MSLSIYYELLSPLILIVHLIKIIANGILQACSPVTISYNRRDEKW